MDTKKACTDFLDNEFNSLTEMCLYYKIPPATYLNRLSAGWNQKDALTVKSQKHTVKDHLDKEYNSLTDMCIEYGKGIETVRYRLKHGWSLESALMTPLDRSKSTEKTKCVDHNGRPYGSLSEMCAAYKIGKTLYNYRKSQGWSLKDILTTPARKKRKTA